MSKHTHTRGPWRTGREDMQSHDSDTGEPFASVYCDEGAEVHLGRYLPGVVAHTFGDACKANARLIAAAPMLLEASEAALRAIVFDWPDEYDEHDELSNQRTPVVARAAKEQLRAAIASAKPAPSTSA